LANHTIHAIAAKTRKGALTANAKIELAANKIAQMTLKLSEAERSFVDRRQVIHHDHFNRHQDQEACWQQAKKPAAIAYFQTVLTDYTPLLKIG
jgi:hypothetical protein